MSPGSIKAASQASSASTAVLPAQTQPRVLPPCTLELLRLANLVMSEGLQRDL